ncbi:MAG: PAS domain-containing protein [Deltaproteobacteria bacterium]|nr:PAS domain-containing protein [Deltaproteobacteria bacterium]
MDNILKQFDSPILKSIKDPITLIDKDFRVLWLNRARATMHQLNRDDVIGRICYQVFFRRKAPCEDCVVQAVFRSGRSRIKEAWLDFPDGSRKWGEVRAYPVYGENRTVDAALTIIIDITEKKLKLERQKRYAEYLSRSLRVLTQEKNRVLSDDGHFDATFGLTDREIEVLRLMTEGFTNNEISEQLSISPHTAKSHVIHIFNKLGVDDRTQAAVLATRHKLI